jgi:hypothetical protein
MEQVRKKSAKAGRPKESSSAFFQNLRPKFLDWKPSTEEEKALEVKARSDAREVELQRVTELAKGREAEKAIITKRHRSHGGGRPTKPRR